MAAAMKTHRLLRDDFTKFMQNRDNYRHRTKKSLFDEFGPCRIAGPNGKFVAIVREDPGPAPDEQGEPVAQADVVSDETMQLQADSIRRQKNSGLHKVPSPKNCKCKEWPWEERPLDERGKPKEHHKACAFAKAWQRQKGTRVTNVIANPTLQPTHRKATPPKNTSSPQPKLLGSGMATKAVKLRDKRESLPLPESCPKCSQFTKNKKMLAEEQALGVVQHHPTCEHYKKYKAFSVARKAIGAATPKPKAQAAGGKQKKVSVWDLETQEVLRLAEADEILEARKALRDTTAAIIKIDEKQYLLMYEDGTMLEPADPEPEPEPKPEPEVVEASAETVSEETEDENDEDDDDEEDAATSDMVPPSSDPEAEGETEQAGEADQAHAG